MKDPGKLQARQDSPFWGSHGIIKLDNDGDDDNNNIIGWQDKTKRAWQKALHAGSCSMIGTAQLQLKLCSLCKSKGDAYRFCISSYAYLLSGKVRVVCERLNDEGQQEVWVLMQHGAS